MTDTPFPRATYDLHLHTHWSYDALVSVEGHFKRAQELGIRCISITEHHVLDSLNEVLDVAKRYPEVRAVPGAELSVTTSVGSVDLLCYGFSMDFPQELKKALYEYHEWQREYGHALSKGLEALGYDFSDPQRLELLRSYRPAHIVRFQGNTHVRNGVLRQHFVDRGFIADHEGYAELLGRVRKAHPLPGYPDVDRVAPAVHAAGALIAIAHPHGYFQQGNRERMDALREECGLDGIECAHASTPAEFSATYRQYCVEHGLFSVGGSDCHTADDLEGMFACHHGEDEWLEEFLERLDRR